MRKTLVVFLIAVILYSCSDRTRNQSNDNNLDGDTAILDTLISPISKLSQKTDSSSTKIKFFIENSGSMTGYVNGRTKFKDVINNLLVDLKYYYGEENIDIYFINSQVYDTELSEDVSSFAGKLSPNSMKVGNISNSNINEIYRIVLDSVSSRTINFLISDNIYSIKGENTNNLLNEQKALTKDAFLSADKKDIATDFYQFRSEFNGNYYDYNNTPIPVETTRPYYLTVLSNENVIKGFLKTFNDKLKTYSGYQNRYFISNTSIKDFEYTLLTQSFNNLKIIPAKKGSNLVKVAEIKVPKRISEPKEFAIATDFRKLVGLDENVLEPSSFKLSDGFKIVEIGEIKDDQVLFPSGAVNINPSDINKMKHQKFSHVIKLETDLNNFKDLTISLLRQEPSWIKASTTIDDSKINSDELLQNKTFGLEYLVGGISEAYSMTNEDNYYLTMNFDLNSSQGSNSTIYIVLFILIGGLITYFILSKR